MNAKCSLSSEGMCNNSIVLQFCHDIYCLLSFKIKVEYGVNMCAVLLLSDN